MTSDGLEPKPRMPPPVAKEADTPDCVGAAVASICGGWLLLLLYSGKAAGPLPAMPPPAAPPSTTIGADGLSSSSC